MGRADYLELGTWNVRCYQCGFKRKANTMERNWQGYYVCPEHNEPRQTQDFVRAIPDMQNVPWSQPNIKPVYVYTNATIGFGDGVTKKFQFGSGLASSAESYTLINVKVSGVTVSGIMNSSGIITLASAPAIGARVTATGTETQQ